MLIITMITIIINWFYVSHTIVAYFDFVSIEYAITNLVLWEMQT